MLASEKHRAVSALDTAAAELRDMERFKRKVDETNSRRLDVEEALRRLLAAATVVQEEQQWLQVWAGAVAAAEQLLQGPTPLKRHTQQHSASKGLAGGLGATAAGPTTPKSSPRPAQRAAVSHDGGVKQDQVL